jgi:hypothetical protein
MWWKLDDNDGLDILVALAVKRSRRLSLKIHIRLLS